MAYSPACASGVYADGLCVSTAGLARPVLGGLGSYYTSMSAVFGLVGLAVFLFLDVPATITLHLLRDAPSLLATAARVVQTCAVPVVLAAAVNSVGVFLSSQVTTAYDNPFWRSKKDNTFVSGALLVTALRWNFVLHIVPMLVGVAAFGVTVGMHRGMGLYKAMATAATSAVILLILAAAYLCTPSSRQVAVPVAYGEAIPTAYAPLRPAEGTPLVPADGGGCAVVGCGAEFGGSVYGLEKIRIAYSTTRPLLPIALMCGSTFSLLALACYAVSGS